MRPVAVWVIPWPVNCIPAVPCKHGLSRVYIETFMDVQHYLQSARLQAEKIEAIMHNQNHPRYGETLHAVKETEVFLIKLKEMISALNAWKTEYEANRCRLWIIHSLKKGEQLLQRYKHSWTSLHHIPTPNMSLLNEWLPVETVVGELNIGIDVRLTSAFNVVYEAVCKISQGGFKKHGGKCLGGLVCILCDGDECDFVNECFRTVNETLVRNIFWNKDLQHSFLEYLERNNLWNSIAPPAEWRVPEIHLNCYIDYSQCRTPFQYAKQLTSNVKDVWSAKVYNWKEGVLGDFLKYQELCRLLPNISQHLDADIEMCREIREMF